MEMINRVLISHFNSEWAVIIIIHRLHTATIRYLRGANERALAACTIVFVLGMSRPTHCLTLKKSNLTSEPSREQIVKNDENDVKDVEESRFEGCKLVSYHFCRELHFILFGKHNHGCRTARN